MNEEPAFPPQLTKGQEADLVIVGSWIKILTHKGLDWCISWYEWELPSGCDLHSTFKVGDLDRAVNEARESGLTVVVETEDA